MKRLIAITLCIALSAPLAFSQKKDIVKTGYNLGPLPVVAYDADKGFQLGAILQLFNYGDGTNYPNYNSKWYLEASFFTKGSQLFQLMYDDKTLIPGVRWSSAVSLALDKAMDFYGFNGYQAYYDFGCMNNGKAGREYTLPSGNTTTGLFSPYYKINRTQLLIKSDFIGNITDHFKWEAGYHASYFKQGAIDRANINKGKSEEKKFPDSEPTLYESYLNWGLISAEEAAGGFNSSIRAGLVYDTRDKEGAPSRGIWAEGHITAAPKWLGTKIPYYRYSLTMRQYFPIVKNDVLTFAYRLNYEGTFGNNAPYYVLPYITVMGENCDKDGYGGYRNLRGIMRNRVVGLDVACWTVEMRWRFVKFHIGKQNIALALNAFSDGAWATRGRNMAFAKTVEDFPSPGDYNAALDSYKKYISLGQTKDTPHVTIGAGFRFIMNENFIVAAEYGTPLTNMLNPGSKNYGQDGKGAFYVNVGYLF